MLKMRKGTVSEMKKYYTMMEIDFDSKELISMLVLQKGMLDGSVDMYVFFDDQSKIDVGYCVVFPKNVYSYVLVKYFALFPWYRYKGIGRDAYSMIEQQYESKYGIIAEIPIFEDNDESQINNLLKFFRTMGYVEIESDYRIGGAETILLCKGLKGSANISKVAHRIMPDFYTRLLPRQKTDIKQVR